MPSAASKLRKWIDCKTAAELTVRCHCIMESQSYIPASMARAALRKVIAKGGSAGVKVGDEFRCLQHFPSCDRPARRLPWPLSKLQPFWFDITRDTGPAMTIVDGVPKFPSIGPGTSKTLVRYTHKQIEEALDTFLEGCKPDDDGCIMIDSRL